MSTDRLAGLLLGCAIGDALGLPCEGMAAATIARRFGRVDRFRLLGPWGFVSDDTEQAALVAQSLVRYPRDVEACARAFRWTLAGWFLRLPFGIGLGTLRACLGILVGRQRGVRSAGNGAAMRAPIIGAVLWDDAAARRRLGVAVAETTHTDPRAVAGALYAAELAAGCVGASTDADRAALVTAALEVAEPSELRRAIGRALTLAAAGAETEEAAATLGTTGYVVATLAMASFAFVRHGEDPERALVEAVGAGGDTDTIAAIAGSWCGALHGASALPERLIERLVGGPFGPAHLRALAEALPLARAGAAVVVPRYSFVGALLRNLSLYPVVLAHGLRRVLPPW